MARNHDTPSWRLRRRGHEVVVAVDGKEGVSVALAKALEGGCDGFDTRLIDPARLLKRTEKLPAGKGGS